MRLNITHDEFIVMLRNEATSQAFRTVCFAVAERAFKVRKRRPNIARQAEAICRKYGWGNRIAALRELRAMQDERSLAFFEGNGCKLCIVDGKSMISLVGAVRYFDSVMGSRPD